MQAIKLTGHINSDRTLHLNLPENALEGPAEVIVLMEEESGNRNGKTEDWMEILESLPHEVTEKKS